MLCSPFGEDLDDEGAVRTERRIEDGGGAFRVNGRELQATSAYCGFAPVELRAAVRTDRSAVSSSHTMAARCTQHEHEARRCRRVQALT